jgi:hypothetical protein
MSDKVRGEFETYYLNANYRYSASEMQKAWEAWQHCHTIIDAKDAEIERLKAKEFEGDVPLEELCLAQARQIAHITKERDDALIGQTVAEMQSMIYAKDNIQLLQRIEVQRVNIEALQTNRAQSRNDEGGV